MSFINVWVHFVWTTIERKDMLHKSFRLKLFKHMRDYALNSGIHLDFINGCEDHVHCLISMRSTQSTAEVMNLVKGESSNWINKNGMCQEHFAWQHEYYAASVDPSKLDVVRNYIKNQESHHKCQNFKDETERLFGVIWKKNPG